MLHCKCKGYDQNDQIALPTTCTNAAPEYGVVYYGLERIKLAKERDYWYICAWTFHDWNAVVAKFRFQNGLIQVLVVHREGDDPLRISTKNRGDALQMVLNLFESRKQPIKLITLTKRRETCAWSVGYVKFSHFRTARCRATTPVHFNYHLIFHFEGSHFRSTSCLVWSEWIGALICLKWAYQLPMHQEVAPVGHNDRSLAFAHNQ